MTAGLSRQDPQSRIRSLLFRQRGRALSASKQISFDGVHRVLRRLFGDCLHAKRILSLAGATLGAIQSGSLAVALIGQGLALARGLNTKYAIKQVDRLLSNEGIDVDALLAHWVPFIVGSRPEIAVALDWTDFDADGQTTLMLSLLTRHGRATPLYWLTVDRNALKGQRNRYEYQVLVRFAAALPDEVKVTVVADRGFCDHKLYRVLRDELKFSFVIRMRANIMVSAASGQRRKAADWVGPGGRARMLHGATVTGLNYPVGTVVCVHAKDMKEPWCLVTDTTDKTARELMNLYAKRWSVECQFRDSKNIRYGMGLGEVRVSTPARRDRLWLINAFAVALLTLLGAAGEALGFDRLLKSNTSLRRTHSLLRQGIMLYQLIPTMPEHRLLPLVEKFAEMLAAHPVFVEMFGAI
jgi:hypothetical protein